MLRFRKSLLTCIVMVTIITLLTGMAFAKPGNGHGYGKKFKDVDDRHWAHKEICMMSNVGIIQGYADATFQPNKPVTKLEAIVLLTRALCDQDDVANATTAQQVDFLNKYLGWGAGYIALAVKEGILTDTEVLGMNFNAPAKRADVARWIANAMDWDEADAVTESTALRFKDAKEIAKADWDSIWAVVSKGIMIGNPNGTFQPNKPVKRVEMAVIIYRLMDKDAAGEVVIRPVVKGKIAAIDAESVKLDNGKTYALTAATKYYKNGQKIDLADVSQGDYVKLVLNADGDVAALKVLEAAAETEEIACQFVKATERAVIVAKAGKLVKYDLGANVAVNVEGDNADLAALKFGQEIELGLNPADEVVSITVEDAAAPAELEVTGTITDLDLEDELLTLEVKVKDSTAKVSLTVIIDDNTDFSGDLTLADLDENDSITVKGETAVEDDELVINAAKIRLN